MSGYLEEPDALHIAQSQVNDWAAPTLLLEQPVSQACNLIIDVIGTPVRISGGALIEKYRKKVK